MSHGHASGQKWSPTYHSWAAMKQRCTDPASTGYPTYGARGIKVCDRWLTFENFLADMGERPAGRSIDRRDSTGDYEPGNCRWATCKEQARNRTNNKLTMDLVTEIRALRRAGWSYVGLGKAFGVSKSMISHIITERAWA